jgi:hypothetical protein
MKNPSWIFFAAFGFAFALTSATSGHAARGYNRDAFLRALDQSDYHIVASERRVGPIRLGMYMDEVATILGAPETVGGNGRDDCVRCIPVLWTYDKKNFQVMFSKGPTPFVTGITVWDEVKWVTAEGIRIGMSVFDVARTYGQDPLLYYCLVPGAALRFYVGRGDRSHIRAIDFHSSDCSS